MAIESIMLRRQFRHYSINDYLAAQHKIDHIQSEQPKSFRGNEKGDEYKFYWEPIKKHAPTKSVTEFLAWNENILIKRIHKALDQMKIRDWGDSYDADEDDETMIDFMWGQIRNR